MHDEVIEQPDFPQNDSSSTLTAAPSRRFTYIAAFIFLTVLAIINREITWQGSKDLHTVMEIVSTLLALFVGFVALVHYYSNNNNMFLFLGTGFIGTALLDGYHAVVTCRWFDENWPSPPESLIPWSWNASRLFLSALMVISWLIWYLENVGVRHFRSEEMWCMSLLRFSH